MAISNKIINRPGASRGGYALLLRGNFLGSYENFEKSMGCCLPAAVLSYTDKKVPKEPAWGGFEWIAPAIQATSPRPLQARIARSAAKPVLFAQYAEFKSSAAFSEPGNG